MNQSFFLDNQAEFYDAEGYQCSSYPNTGGKATYNIVKGKKATGKEFYGVNGEKYLEMDLGGTIYKWQLQYKKQSRCRLFLL